MNASDANATRAAAKQRSIIQMNPEDAKAFLLKQESYCSLDLPPYFQFDELISRVAKELEGKSLPAFKNKSPRDFEGVNHTILNNKDGRYAWRPFQLIHPALYVSLVSRLTEEANWKTICDRFTEFGKAKTVNCLSLPGASLTDETDKAEQVSHWWHAIEQRSIELALDYEYVVHADVTDCYGAIYTHSIAWAVHEKQVAKENKGCKKLIGNVIDSRIQDMRHGQTNGIPQGSVLMDFIAEIVLGYADLELAKKVEGQNCSDYIILRYRDDYRIFTNNPQDGERILKCLTETLIDLGLKLNAAKTKASNLVISDSIKGDKLAWIRARHADKSIQKHLLIIHAHGMSFPNAGSLAVALADFYKRLIRFKKVEQPLPLISICVDIAYRNPRTYPICAAILSKLLGFVDSEKEELIGKISARFSQLPNTGHMQIWLQRISIRNSEVQAFTEPLCKLVQGASVAIWNTDWISSKTLKSALDAKGIFDHEKAEKLAPIIPLAEVELFKSITEYY